LLLLTAILFNNITRRRYPHPPQLDHRNPHRTADPRPTDRIGFTPTDLEDVLKQYNQVLDVTRDDLETIFLQTEMHAYRRRFGEITCADIMSRDLVTAEFGTTLEQAWALMREHRIKALPVIDRARRITGIVTLADFMKHAQLDAYDGFEARLRRFIQRIPFTHSEKPEVVGQIMTRAVVTADHNMHIVEVVPLLSDYGLHHIPVLDDAQRLVGIVTQSDLIAALYRGRVVDAAESDIRH
jgi:CBS domain-containing membrane protein